MKFDLGYINKVVAVSVDLDGDKQIMHYQTLQFKKGELVFGKGEKHLLDVKELVKKASNKLPYIVHFNGKGILNRSVPRIENYRHSLLMNANLDDFYFSDYVDEDTAYSSVIRQSTAKEILELFKKNKVEVISFGSGPFIAAPVIDLIDKDVVTVNNVQLQSSSGKLGSFERSEENRSATFLGEDQVSHDMLGAVALAVQFFHPSDKVLLPEEAEVYEINLNEAKQKNIFFRFGMGMMLFFLLILTSNYFYLGYLNGKIESNYVELAEFEDQLGQLSTLEDEKNRKEKLLQGSGLLYRKFLSFYLMELSNSVPKDITLNEVEVRPLLDEIKRRHKIEFNDRLIMVKGQSKSSEILSNWIDRLKGNEWLASVDILDYSYKKNVGNFEIEIILN